MRKIDIITAREANQQFSRLLREVERGRDFVITRNGVPVARLSPPVAPGERALTADQEAALSELLASLRIGLPLQGARADREAIYADRFSDHKS